MADIGRIKPAEAGKTQPVESARTQPVESARTQPVNADKTQTLQLSPKGEEEDKTVRLEKAPESSQKMAAAPPPAPAPAFNPDVTTKLELVKDDDDKTVRLPGGS